MRTKIWRKFWPAAFLTAIMLAGCSNSEDSSTTGTEDVAKAQTGTVNLAVQFPIKSLKKAMIDERATSIIVEWWDAERYNLLGETELIPDANGYAMASLEIPIGLVEFSARAIETTPDPNDPLRTYHRELEYVSTVGKIVAGENEVHLTFLAGDWLLVDGNDNPLSLVVGKDTSSRTLAGFSLYSYQYSYFDNYATAAKIDPSLPTGWSDYALQWYTDGTTPIGRQLEAGQESQFDGGSGVNASSFWGDWLNLSSPQTEIVVGDRLLFFLDYMDSDGSIVDEQGTDMKPTLDGVSDTQILDGNHITGHLLEMTMDSETSTLLESNVDCRPYWSDEYQYTAQAAKAASIRDQVSGNTSDLRKAAPGDSSTLYSGTITVTWQECIEQDYMFDGDGDGDYRWEYLFTDVNGNGQYDAADGDEFRDDDGDGVFDWNYYNEVDGDGDGDYSWDYLTTDINYNGLYDAADGDEFTDNDGDGKFDYTYTPGDLYTDVETFSDLVVHEFRAKGSQAVSSFAPSIIGGWGTAIDTWRPSELSSITFLDGTHYIMAENGQPDIDPVTGAVTGGPGMEYGTYTFDPATGDFTASVIEQTNGDWGAEGSGTILRFSDLNTIAGTDLDGSAFRLERDVTRWWEPVAGSWIMGDAEQGLTVVTFFDQYGTYMAASYAGSSGTGVNGMEMGYYYVMEPSEGTFSLQADGFSSTLNGTSVICPSDQSCTIDIEVVDNTLNLLDGSGRILTRVAPF